MGLIASPPSWAPNCLRVSAGRPDLSGRASGHAAKVLRPRPVDRAVDDDVSEFPGAELLRIRRKCEVGVDLPSREQPLALGGGMLGEGDVLLWIQPDVSKHAGQEDVCGLTQL